MKKPYAIRLLEYYDRRYFHGKPAISDARYDEFRASAHQKYINNVYFKKVGAEPPDLKSKVNTKLPVPMPGLEKIRPSTAASWASRHSGPIVLSSKHDGLAVLLYYADGIFERAYSRGTDEIGQDITRHIRGNVPKILAYDHTRAGVQYEKTLNPQSGDIVIRGEVTIRQSAFEEVAKTNPGKYKNSRAMVNGLLNRKEPTGMTRLLEFHAHELAFPALADPVMDFINFKVFNIPHVEYRVFNSEDIDESLIKKQIKFFKSRDYPCDGIVLAGRRNALNGKAIGRISCKLETFDQPYAETVVKKVTWRLSDRGLMKPTIHIRPVTIDGFTNNTATGNNAKEIAALKIGAGSTIRLVRAGDVIPHILKDVNNKPTPGKTNIPTHCPQCETRLIYSRTAKGAEGVDLYCPNDRCADMRRASTFFTRMNPIGIGPEIIKRLVEGRSVRKVFLLKSEFLKQEFGEVKGDQIYRSIRQVMKCPLEKIMYASGCFSSPSTSLGVESVTNIFNQIISAPVNAITLAELTDEKTSMNRYIERIRRIVKPSVALEIFMDNISTFRRFYATVEKWHKPTTQTEKYKGMVFCFTGFRHAEAIDHIRENGGGYRSSLTRDVTHLVFANKDSEKYQKARKSGLTCWSQRRMMEFIGMWKPIADKST